MSTKLMTKRQHAAMVRKLETIKATIAKQRDKLRDLIDEAEEFEDVCKDAIEGMETAADRMSEYV